MAMFRTWIAPVAIVVICLLGEVRADVMETTSIEEVMRLLEACPEDAVIFVDIDDTIITPKANMFRSKSPDKHFIDELKKDRNNVPNFDVILSTWRLNRKAMLIAKEWPQIIARKKEVRGGIYALTQMDGGPAGLMPSVEEWRFNEMAALGVAFTPTLDGQSQGTLLPPLVNNTNAYLKGPALFYKGFVITGARSKGEVVRKFLETHKPERVVFIDDRQDHIADVAQACADMQMPYLGIVFRGVDLLEGEVSQEVVALQKERLLQAAEWLEDATAAAVLEQR